MFEKQGEGFFVLSQKELDKLNQLSELEQLKLEQTTLQEENNNLRLRLLQAEQIASETSSTQQELIESLIALGVM